MYDVCYRSRCLTPEVDLRSRVVPEVKRLILHHVTRLLSLVDRCRHLRSCVWRRRWAGRQFWDCGDVRWTSSSGNNRRFCTSFRTCRFCWWFLSVLCLRPEIRTKQNTNCSFPELYMLDYQSTCIHTTYLENSKQWILIIPLNLCNTILSIYARGVFDK